MKKGLIGLLQIGALTVFAMIMSTFSSWLHLPIPGSIVGMAVLFILLETGVVKLNWVEVGASWLLAELLLFFVPSAIGIMKYASMLEADGLRVLAVVIAGTFVVLSSSGLLTTFIYKTKEGKHDAERTAVSDSDSGSLSGVQADLHS